MKHAFTFVYGLNLYLKFNNTTLWLNGLTFVSYNFILSPKEVKTKDEG